jgi:hypothetical protein
MNSAYPGATWDGTTPLATSGHPQETAIVQDILHLWDAIRHLPAWTGGNTPGWKAAYTQAFNAGARRICTQYHIDNILLWHWFCDQAHTIRAQQGAHNGGALSAEGKDSEETHANL